MTDSRNDQPTQTEANDIHESAPQSHGHNSDRPDMIAYTVQSRGEDKKAIWTRIGAAWGHRDGKGYELRFSCMPLDGRLTLRFQDKARAETHDQDSAACPEPR